MISCEIIDWRITTRMTETEGGRRKKMGEKERERERSEQTLILSEWLVNHV